jgi:hypothetical protein
MLNDQNELNIQKEKQIKFILLLTFHNIIQDI